MNDQLTQEGFPPKDKMTISGIEALKRKGWNQTQISEYFGVTRQAVSKMRHKYATQASWSPREMAHQKYWPWNVVNNQVQSAPYKRLRDHVEYVATGGVNMTWAQQRDLLGFYERLRREDAVIEYHPDIPPIDGTSGTWGGWAFRPREASDGDLIIRVNEVTQMTEEGRFVWSFPPTDPLSDWDFEEVLKSVGSDEP